MEIVQVVTPEEQRLLDGDNLESIVNEYREQPFEEEINRAQHALVAGEWNIGDYEGNLTKIESGEEVSTALDHLKDSIVVGDLENVQGLGMSNNVLVRGSVRGGNVCCDSRNTVFLSETFETAVIDGPNAVIAESFDADNLKDSMVITGHDHPEADAIYTGDWDRFWNYADNHLFDGTFEDLHVFEARRQEFSSFEEFTGFLEYLNEKSSQISEEITLYNELGHVVQPLEGTNRERVKRLSSIDEELVDWFDKSNVFSTNEMAVSAVRENHTYYLLRQLLDISEDTEMSVVQFLETFSDKPEEYVRKPDFTFSDALENYRFEDVREDQAYLESIKFLRDVWEGHRDFETKPNTELIEQLHTLNNEISKAECDPGSEEFQNLIRDKNLLKAEIAEREEEFRKDVLRRKGITEDQLYSNDTEISPKVLSDTLESLATEHLEGKTAEQAEEYAHTLGAQEMGTEAKLEVWNKRLEDLPSYDEYNACTFPDGLRFSETGMITYMAGEDIQLLEIKADGKKGIAVTALAEHHKDFLVVNSVESVTNMFQRQDISRFTDEAIREYARTMDRDAVLYCTNSQNTAPQQFLEHLPETEGSHHYVLSSFPYDKYLDLNPEDYSEGRETRFVPCIPVEI